MFPCFLHVFKAIPTSPIRVFLRQSRVCVFRADKGNHSHSRGALLCPLRGRAVQLEYGTAPRLTSGWSLQVCAPLSRDSFLLQVQRDVPSWEGRHATELLGKVLQLEFGGEETEEQSV